MNQEPRYTSSGYIQSAYLKIKAFLQKTAAHFREKYSAYLLELLLYHSDAQMLKAELSRYHKSFAYLLEPTTRFLLGMPTAYFTTADSLDNAWAYCLDDDTPCLQQFYSRLRQDDKEDTLRLWIVFLRKQGFCRVLEDKDTVEISPASRKYFDNTLGIEDSTMLPIETHPWTYAGDLIVGGMVKHL